MLLITFSTLLLSSANFFTFVNGKSQFVEPLNTGLHFGIPYDIANIFIRPIAGVTSIILTVGLGIVLFFGVITSPFGYFFGVPSRKYVLGGQNNTATRRYEDFAFESILTLNPGANKMEVLQMQPRSLDVNSDQIGADIEPETGNYPTFAESVFRLFPDEENIMDDRACSLLLVCYSHGSFQYAPPMMSRLYKVFSKSLWDIPPEYKEAVIIGLQLDHYHLCENMYKDCPKSLMTLLVKTVTRLLPERARRKPKFYQV